MDKETSLPADTERCLQCDSVLQPGSEVCLMCGAVVAPQREEVEHAGPESEVAPGAVAVAPSAIAHGAQQDDEDAQPAEPVVIEEVMKERRSRVVLWMTFAAFLITAAVGALVLRYSGPVQMALVPSPTPLPPTPTSILATTIAQPVTAPTIEPEDTATPTSTPTLQPPRLHQVAGGETLFGLALFYGVSMESIAALNDFAVDMPIQAGQALQVPWPTATPPLEPILFEINGEPVVADPTSCERYEIQEGDAISVIAARYNIDFELLEQVNRLNENVILQPGDTICIPKIVYGDVLPPTPGPSPTASATSFPSGPALLYPPDGEVIEMGEEPVLLQWVAVKDLAQEEWYMIEVVDTDSSAQRPYRGFTRDNAFRVPTSWRPEIADYRDIRWQVSIVRVRGRRDDGGFIYDFGGRSSAPGYFVWLGAVPTATPTATATPSPTSTP